VKVGASMVHSGHRFWKLQSIERAEGRGVSESLISAMIEVGPSEDSSPLSYSGS
jgi:hypothetical protein